MCFKFLQILEADLQPNKSWAKQYQQLILMVFWSSAYANLLAVSSWALSARCSLSFNISFNISYINANKCFSKIIITNIK